MFKSIHFLSNLEPTYKWGVEINELSVDTDSFHYSVLVSLFLMSKNPSFFSFKNVFNFHIT